MSIESFHIDALPNQFWANVNWFLFSISYEARSPVVRKRVPGAHVRCMGFYNANHEYNSDALAKAKSDLPEMLAVALDSDQPLKTLDAIRQAVGTLVAVEGLVGVAVDITCFTREALAMLVMTLKHLLPEGSRIFCVYNPAKSYGGIANREPHQAWLSRGIVDIRSILGFRGRVSLIADTHLILIPGIEIERAHCIIDALQPNRITIGYIESEESIRPELVPVVTAMHERLVNYYPDQRVSKLAFSAKNPVFTMRRILECASEDENCVVACLNTKLAMMGVVMAALRNRDIQIIYAQPVAYNVSELSEPSEEVLVFEIVDGD
jgi:hypothetical protein